MKLFENNKTTSGKKQSFFEKLRLIKLILRGQIRFNQRTLSFQEVFDKMKAIKLKYHPSDEYVSLTISKMHSMTKMNGGDVEYSLYSNLPYPNSIKDSNLDKCFEEYELFVSGKTKEIETDSIKIEL